MLCLARSATVKVLTSDMMLTKRKHKWWGGENSRRRKRERERALLYEHSSFSMCLASLRSHIQQFIFKWLSAKVLVVDHIDDQEHKHQDDRRCNQLVGCHSTSSPPPPSIREKRNRECGKRVSFSLPNSISCHNHMPNPFKPFLLLSYRRAMPLSVRDALSMFESASKSYYNRIPITL